jgi:hypothetical protein
MRIMPMLMLTINFQTCRLLQTPRRKVQHRSHRLHHPTVMPQNMGAIALGKGHTHQETR